MRTTQYTLFITVEDDAAPTLPQEIVQALGRAEIETQSYLGEYEVSIRPTEVDTDDFVPDYYGFG